MYKEEEKGIIFLYWINPVGSDILGLEDYYLYKLLVKLESLQKMFVSNQNGHT